MALSTAWRPTARCGSSRWASGLPSRPAASTDEINLGEPTAPPLFLSENSFRVRKNIRPAAIQKARGIDEEKSCGTRRGSLGSVSRPRVPGRSSGEFRLHHNLDG